MTVDELLAAHDPVVQETARWVRGVLLDADADLRERVWPGWHGLGYRHPRAGHVCGIFPREDDVALVFEHGVELADRDGLLSGEGSRTRAVVLTAPGSIPAASLVGLLHEAIALRA